MQINDNKWNGEKESAILLAIFLRNSIQLYYIFRLFSHSFRKIFSIFSISLPVFLNPTSNGGCIVNRARFCFIAFFT